jgi:GNAT superfamily N-acetyltransferase
MVLARLEPTDRASLCRFFYRLSAESLYRRFQVPIQRPDQVPADRLLSIDGVNREAVVGVVDGEIVGVARFSRLEGSDTAEIAVVVADAWQGQGIGTRLLSALREYATDAGIRRFVMVFQADNRKFLSLARRSYRDFEPTLRSGYLEATVSVA